MSFALFAIFGLLYGYTLPHHYTYDGLCYALDVERGPLMNIFHPGHLLYSALQRLLWHATGFVGYHGPAIYLMQAINVAAAAGAVTLFFVLLAKKTDRGTATAGASLFGVSYAFWFEAADPGCYAFAALAAVGVLWLLEGDLPLKPFLIGLGHGGLVLFHQMLILVAPAFFIRGMRWDYFAGLVLGAIVPYALVAGFFHRASLHDALYWALGPAGPPPGTSILSSYWWSVNVFSNVKTFIEALAHSFVGEGRWAWVGYGVASVVILMTARISRKSAPLWLWLAALGLFEFFFAPGALRFRILLLPPLLYLALAGRRVPLVWLGVALVAALNFMPILKKRSLPPDAARVAWLRHILTPADLLVYSGQAPQSLMNVYFVYFAPELSGQSLNGYFFSRPAGDFYELDARIRQVQAHGGRVFFEDTLERAPYKKKAILEGPDGYKLFQAK